MKYVSTKFVPFKKLLEIKNSNRLYIFNWYENWILECYESYNKRKTEAISIIDKQYINNWWKGCLKKYNTEKYVN